MGVVMQDVAVAQYECTPFSLYNLYVWSHIHGMHIYLLYFALYMRNILPVVLLLNEALRFHIDLQRPYLQPFLRLKSPPWGFALAFSAVKQLGLQ